MPVIRPHCVFYDAKQTSIQEPDTFCNQQQRKGEFWACTINVTMIRKAFTNNYLSRKVWRCSKLRMTEYDRKSSTILEMRIVKFVVIKKKKFFVSLNYIIKDTNLVIPIQLRICITDTPAHFIYHREASKGRNPTKTMKILEPLQMTWGFSCLSCLCFLLM